LFFGYYFILKSNYHKAFTIVKYQNSFLLRFHNQITFLNKSVLKSHFLKMNSGENLILDFSNCTFIDSDIIDVINDFQIHAAYEKIHIEYKFQYVGQLEKLQLKPNQI
jgi:MFS superfamily sulfate permease-like transporter